MLRSFSLRLLRNVFSSLLQPSAMNDSLDLREGSEVEISRLFPKCRPRSTPTSPDNPPTTPVPTSYSTTLSTSNIPSYQTANVSLHSSLDYALQQSTNPLINAALNKSPHLNPNTITYSANSLPLHGYPNQPTHITSNTLSFDTTNITSHQPNQSANVKTIHPSVIPHPNHNNFNCIAQSDDNDNYDTSLTVVEDAASRMQESSSSNGSSSSSDSNSSSRMSVDTASSNCSPGNVGGTQTTMGSTINNSVDVSVVSAYHEADNNRSSVLDSSYEDMPMPQTRREFRLRDSRIEAAGGREVYSQSRSRMHRHRGSISSAHHNSLLNNQQLMKQHQLVQIQQQQQQQQQTQQLTSQAQNTNLQLESQQTQPMDNSSASSSCSRTSRESGLPSDSPLVYEARLAGSSEVVFDDIGEWSGGLTVRGMDGQTHASSTPTSGPDSESPEISPTRVTKIGNVPIADYEGSPRRYGPRSGSMRYSPRRGHSLRPRPGFPRRISGYTADDSKSNEKKELTVSAEQIPQKDKWVEKSLPTSSIPEIEARESPAPPVISISTLTSVYGSTLDETASQTTTATSTTAENKSSAADQELMYDYEVSETQKVLQEFFQDTRVSRAPPQAFYDLEYHLKRHHGNSYVGQRLAEEYGSDEPGLSKDSYKHQLIQNNNSDDNFRKVSDSKSKSMMSDMREEGRGEECSNAEDGDQVIKFKENEVSCRLSSSLHQFASQSHRHFAPPLPPHTRKYHHDAKQLHGKPLSPSAKAASPSHILLNSSPPRQAPCHCHMTNSSVSCTSTSSSLSSVFIEQISSNSKISKSFINFSPSTRIISPNCQNLVDCGGYINPSSDIQSISRPVNSFDEDLIGLTDQHSDGGHFYSKTIEIDDEIDQSSDLNEDCEATSFVSDSEPNKLNRDSSPIIPATAEDDLVDLDDDDEEELEDDDVEDEELRVSINPDEDEDCEQGSSTAQNIETINDLLDLPIMDCPIEKHIRLGQPLKSCSHLLSDSCKDLSEQCDQKAAEYDAVESIEMKDQDHHKEDDQDYDEDEHRGDSCADGEGAPLLMRSSMGILNSSSTLDAYLEMGHQVTSGASFKWS